ncbi:MAG: TAT-variant-translocated molybdopterin oxidoreductase [Balneolaceae bacterium]
MSEEVKQNSYWKSLKELSRNEEYEKFLHREFPENASEMTDQVSRRSFLRVMGASIALAGFAACRRPAQKILPYSAMPENMVLGEPQFYATGMPFQDTVTGLLAENNEGRPTKIEGNELHPSSSGRTNIYHQAAILGLYDPDRSRAIHHNGERASREEFIDFVREHFSDGNRRIAFVSGENSSPTLSRLRNQAESAYPNAQWVNWEAFGEENSLEGARMAYGQRLRTVPHFDRASVILSLDDDFMNPWAHKNSVINAKELNEGRQVRSVEDRMSRLYMVESNFSNTGSMADHRLRLKASEIETFARALAERLSRSISGLNAFSSVNNRFTDHDWVETVAADLLSHRSESLVTAGTFQGAELHAIVAAINLALGNIGQTLTLHELPHDSGRTSVEGLRFLTESLQAGEIDTVILLGTNPVFNAPSDLGFPSALEQAGTVIHLSDYIDETSRLATWHIPHAHFLEAWGDGLGFGGHRSVIQPQIAPLHDGWSDIELLHLIVDREWSDGYDLVRETWQSFYPGNFEQQWRRILHDGIDPESGFEPVSVSLNGNFSSEIQSGGTDPVQGIEITIRPHSTIFDGRFANNGWLMELPDPMTKITWDNVALMSPATARDLGISVERGLSERDTPVIRIEADGETIEIAAWVQPGHADNSISLTAGFGRRNAGRVGNGVGVDVYPLRTTDSMYIQSASVTVTGQSYEIACVQDHHSLEGRALIRKATLEEYRENPDFASFENVHGYPIPGLKEGIAEGGDRPISLFSPQQFPEHEPQWGMAIDLNSCFGCGVCTIACQAENNIPVIGKREVTRRRIMHWIRTDRYYEGDADNPKALHQPVPCMHCDMAPCEQVCPVAATTQSEDGINQMTYNRCIGTRYCSNNCPFKVRRFNFFNYTKEYLTTGDDPEIIQMAMNPDVTIRFRGVMEKCTYCVQRLHRAKLATRRETGSKKPADGTVETACQQACPANAISFGDLTDPESHVTRLKRNERNYVMLEELNVRPRTSYLARLNNPNPELTQ